MASQAPPVGAQPQALQDPETALAGLLQSLTPESMAVLRDVQADLLDQDAEALAGLSDILDFLEANPDQYAATVAELVEDDVLEDDVLPPQYDGQVVKLMNALVKSAMQAGMSAEPGMQPQGFAAGGLASLGRGGDSVMAHITPGEAYMLHSRGGSGSINPYTGRPEFFLKKIGKGIKKAVKGVGKVLKKAAPIILPIALNIALPGLGAIASGAIGSALGTAINGGGLKDSLKAGLMGGAAGAAFAGAQGVMGGEGFMAGVRGGLPAGMRPAQAALAQAAQTPGTDALQSIDTGGLPGLVPEGGSVAAQRAAEGFGPQLPGAAQGALQPIDTSALPQAIPEGGTVGSPQPGQSTLQRFTDPVKDFYSERLSPSRGMPTPEALAARTQELTRAGIPATEAYKMASQELTPSMLSRYGPLAAVGAGAAYLGGLFDQPELEYPGLIPGETGMDLYEANPELYSGYSGGSPNQSFQAQPSPQPQYTQVGARPPVMAGIPSLTQSFQQARGFAAGGTTYARGGPPVRARGAIRGPGTERSDDIPAWLSDGEFVITAKAVRGAGGGDPRRGAKTMYELMNRLERQA
jgi:hypothetical protein